VKKRVVVVWRLFKYVCGRKKSEREKIGFGSKYAL